MLEIKSDHCQICQAHAFHSNYGVLTCESCKIFFRRNAFKEQKNARCHFDGDCHIDILNRHACTFCRLKKCFDNGMELDRIRGSRSSKKTHQLSTLHLLQADTSKLDANQWTLLTQLIYNYDERKLLAIAEQIIEQADHSDEFFSNIYQTSGGYIRSNAELRCLSSDDRSGFLRNLADNVACLGAVFTWSWAQLSHCQSFVNICIELYGQNSLLNFQRTLKYLDPDIIVAKLTLSLFAFSNNLSIFSLTIPDRSLDTLAIYHIQNLYAEITWKYLVYRYGYSQSIQRFNNLIRCLLAAILIVVHGQTIVKHRDDMQTLVEQTELALILDEIERVE